MTDFHTHILPGMDDGSRSGKESQAMLREEARQGISTVVLTPHFYAFENSPAEFLEKRRRALAALAPYREAGMPGFLVGAEVLYFEGICNVATLDQLRIRTTALLLLEMPMCPWTERMIADVLELNRRPGFRVVLAHIERYLHLQPRGTVERLVSEGVLIQANVAFFAHWRTRHRALRMASRGQIHLLGSDCHSMGARRPNWDTLPKQARTLARQADRILRQYTLESPDS